MGLFERAGRAVGKLTREVEAAADEAASHRCVECGEGYYTARETCGECGAEVEPAE